MPPELPPLIATYRLQLGPAFTLADARRTVPYLAALGISHLYLSPIWEAAPGSTHGYDIVDHAGISSVLGGVGELYALAAEAERHRLGLVFDLVPNHVGIRGGVHPWWRDVLRYGQSSPYAPYFDIDWSQGTGVLVCPALGTPLGAALEAGELTLDYFGGELVVRHFDGTFPLAPATYHMVLGMPPIEEWSSAGTAAELVRIVAKLRDVAPDEAAPLLQQFTQVADGDDATRAWIESRLRSFDGTPGQPDSFDRLEAVMQAQSYRLAHSTVSGDEVNYRRFFDVNELAGIRQEDAEVFEATHGLLRGLAGAGLVAGVRVDHVDGLHDPASYLLGLRRLLDETAPSALIWVEKILAPDEELPKDWPVVGTTGYDFLAPADQLFADVGGLRTLTETYVEFIEDRANYRQIAFEARRHVADRLFAGEIQGLALQLHRLAMSNRLERDSTVQALRDALVAVLAGLDVYRTYLDGDEPRSVDREVVRQASAAALHRDPTVTREAVKLVERVLLLDARHGGLTAEERANCIRFRRRLQQLSGGIMGKGVEDTAFYRYHALLATNEVGGGPDRTPRSTNALHAWFRRRAVTSPDAMSATSTHDTKRSEDARLRLWTLTELPHQWRRTVRGWARLNARHRQVLHGEPVPDAATEYALYQTLVASWPGFSDEGYRERIRGYLVKSLREAKLRTSSINVKEDYERAVLQFVDRILDPVLGAAFLGRLHSFVEAIAPASAVHGLSLVALKTLAPGVPDFYQGSELPLYLLVDPDNRRPVDFEVIEASLRALQSDPPGVRDPRAKLWLTRALLAERKRQLALYARGSYEPLVFEGPASSRFFGFTRHYRGASVAVLLPIHVHELVEASGNWREHGLEGERVTLPEGQWRSALTGAICAGGMLDLAPLLSTFPVAVLCR